MAKKIEDFGEKINGAKKELAALRRGLSVDDIADWSDEERQKYVTKAQVFKKPNYEQMKEDGMPVSAIYFVKKVYDSLPARPCRPTEEYQKGYIDFMNYFEEKLSEISTVQDAQSFFGKAVKECPYVHNNRATQEAYGCMNNKVYGACQYNSYKIESEIKKKQFLYSDEDKYTAKYKFFYYNGDNAKQEKAYDGRDVLALREGGSTYYFYNFTSKDDISNWQENTYMIFSINDRTAPITAINVKTLEEAKALVTELEKAKEENAPQKKPQSRKKGYVPPQLEHIERSGLDYRDGRDISGEDMLSAFSFKGGEFGNWENQNDRQTNLNMSFEAFKDLAKALDVADEDISLGGKLAIAFGARGSGNAVAHYEPVENVINLTKMKGAGSLAHEWGHAFDRFIAVMEAQKNNIPIRYDEFASDSLRRNGIFSDVMNKIRYADDSRREYSDFYKNACKLDKNFSRAGNQGSGYWNSSVELFARAFSTYILDKMEAQGEKNDYLTGHAEGAGFDKNANIIPTYPQGEERKRINEAFDKVFDVLKEKGYLHQRQPDKEHKTILQQDEKTLSTKDKPIEEESKACEQMSFFNPKEEPITTGLWKTKSDFYESFDAVVGMLESSGTELADKPFSDEKSFFKKLDENPSEIVAFLDSIDSSLDKYNASEMAIPDLKEEAKAYEIANLSEQIRTAEYQKDGYPHTSIESVYKAPLAVEYSVKCNFSSVTCADWVNRLHQIEYDKAVTDLACEIIDYGKHISQNAGLILDDLYSSQSPYGLCCEANVLLEHDIKYNPKEVLGLIDTLTEIIGNDIESGKFDGNTVASFVSMQDSLLRMAHSVEEMTQTPQTSGQAGQRERIRIRQIETER